MSTSNSCQTISMVELFTDVLTEGVACATRRNTPAAAVIRVRPEQIADRSLMRHFLNAIKLSNLVKSVDRWRQTTVKTENLILNNSGQGQVIEKLSEDFPHVSITIFTEALIVETVYLCDLARFVVTAENGDTVLEADLEGDEQGNSLNRVVSTIDVVAHKKVI